MPGIFSSVHRSRQTSLFISLRLSRFHVIDGSLQVLFFDKTLRFDQLVQLFDLLYGFDLERVMSDQLKLRLLQKLAHQGQFVVADKPVRKQINQFRVCVQETLLAQLDRLVFATARYRLVHLVDHLLVIVFAPILDLHLVRSIQQLLDVSLFLVEQTHDLFIFFGNLVQCHVSPLEQTVLLVEVHGNLD